MSIKRMTAVWEHSQHKGSSLLLLLALADNAADDGYCWPGIDYLAQKTRLDQSTVIRQTRLLEKSGELFVVHNRRSGNKYIVRTGMTQDQIKATIINRLPHVAAELKAVEAITCILQHCNLQVRTCNLQVQNLQSASTELAHVQEEPSIPVSDPSIEPSLVASNNPKILPNPTPAQQMFTRLAQLCQIDLELVTKQDRGKLNQVGKKLRDNGKTPTHLDRFEQYWYAADWRGKQGQSPQPHDVLSNWGRAKEWLSNGGNNAKRNEGRSEPVESSEAATRRAIEDAQAAHAVRVLAERAQAGGLAV